MTMDLYGHLVDTSLWEAAGRFTGHSPATTADKGAETSESEASALHKP